MVVFPLFDAFLHVFYCSCSNIDFHLISLVLLEYKVFNYIITHLTVKINQKMNVSSAFSWIFIAECGAL